MCYIDKLIKNQGTENLIKTNVIHDSLLLARISIWQRDSPDRNNLIETANKVALNQTSPILSYGEILVKRRVNV